MFRDAFECGACLAAGLPLGLLAAVVIKKRKLVPLYLKCLAQTAQNKSGIKMVFVARPDLRMGSGKLASQCAHAAVSCYKAAIATCPEVVAVWEITGQSKVVCRSDSEGDERMLQIAQQAKDIGLISSVVRDAGRTQVEHGTVTVVGIGPGDSELINRLTGHLKLM